MFRSSLQLKVKRLKEEREWSLREKENSVEKPDLEKDSEKFRAKEEQKERDDEPEKSSPENVDGEPVTGEESDRENQSFNESNSTDPKGGTRDNGVEESEKKREPVETITGRPDPVSGDLKPTGEGSCNGSSDTVPKESAAPPVGKSLGSVKAREAGDSPELWESMAESKGGGDEETKENSDVQSSASLSKKNRRKAISGSSSGDEPETEEVSPAIKRISVKSEPLMSFLEIIRSHKYGSVFERRLDSQDTTKYTSLVRQHVDLELVQSRLDEGRYNSCSSKFFRDLLLLFNNAIVFFAKYSPESVAAIALRELVTKEMANRNTKKPDTSADEPPQLPPVPLPTKLSSEPTDSLFAKPKSIGPIIACRKRSSISAKASTAAIDRKGDLKPSTIGATATAVIDEKPLIDAKQADNVADEKKRMRDRLTTSGTRSLRAGNKSRATTTTSKILNANSSQSPERSSSPPSGKGGVAPEDSPEPKVEKKNNNTTAVAKKRSAANFLNRMKRNSSSNGTLLETLKSSVNGSNNNKGVAGGVEQKKNSGKSDGRKDQSPQQRSGGKHAREQRNPAKRSVGRPPKKAMRQTSLPPPVPSKRVRETVETEAMTSRQATKRKRR
uniref:Bromo domain-containing protein n=1 Tax=Nelumbo nucifera TaxID=4432 RepID=A0A822ZCF3_NELNU|nr:TPA_asm: hypothetical protein HUJ06_000440 [Nelumbo nucifera]